MMNSIIFYFIGLIEIFILYFGIRFLHIYYTEEKKNEDIRQNNIEKRLFELENEIKKLKEVIKK